MRTTRNWSLSLRPHARSCRRTPGTAASQPRGRSDAEAQCGGTTGQVRTRAGLPGVGRDVRGGAMRRQASGQPAILPHRPGQRRGRGRQRAMLSATGTHVPELKGSMRGNGGVPLVHGWSAERWRLGTIEPAVNEVSVRLDVVARAHAESRTARVVERCAVSRGTSWFTRTGLACGRPDLRGLVHLRLRQGPPPGGAHRRARKASVLRVALDRSPRVQGQLQRRAHAPAGALSSREHRGRGAALGRLEDSAGQQCRRK